MKQIEVNGEIIEFPATMSDDEITAVLRQQFPAPSAQMPTQPSTAMRLSERSLVDRLTDPQNWLNTMQQSLPSIGALAGGVGGAALGAVGGPAGMMAGSAYGAALGGGAGESLRQLTAGEPANPLQALTTAATEGALDLTGARAVEAIIGTGRLAKDIYNEGGVGAVLRMTRSSEADPREELLLRNLQQKLEEQYNTTLRGSQIAPQSTRIGAIEATAESSIGGSPALRTVAERHNQYVQSEMENIIRALSGPNAPDKETTGKLIQNTIDNSRAASSLEFGQRFNELTRLGKRVQVDLGPLQSSVKEADDADRLAYLSSEAREKGKKLSYLADPRLAGLRQDILNLAPNMTFSDAYDILKRINRKIDEVYDVARPKDPIIRDLLSVKSSIKEAMLKAADESGDDTLRKAYTSLMSDYEKTFNTLYSETALSLMRLDQPEQAGRVIAAAGATTRPKEVKRILEEAKRLGVSDADKNVFGGVKRGFLEKSFKTPLDGAEVDTNPFTRLNSFREKLTDPDFLGTMRVLFKPEEIKVLENFLEEGNVLSRSVGGELALSVRSRQLGAATGAIRPDRSMLQRLGDIATLSFPNILADAVSKPDIANKLLGNMRKARMAAMQGKQVSAETLAQINGGLVALGGNALLDVDKRENRAEIERLRSEILGE